MLYLAIPTVTIIGRHPENPGKVAMLKPAKGKHHGKPVLPGGRLNLSEQELPEAAAPREFHEEMGGKGATLAELVRWATRTDSYAEPREKRLHEITPGTQTSIAGGLFPVTAYYACPDFIFTAVVCGELWPNDGEAEECFWFDLQQLKIAPTPEESMFGGQHDLILGVYCLSLQARVCMSGLPNRYFANTQELRETLRTTKIGAPMA